jgi:hypothetical protein
MKYRTFLKVKNLGDGQVAREAYRSHTAPEVTVAAQIVDYLWDKKRSGLAGTQAWQSLNRATGVNMSETAGRVVG